MRIGILEGDGFSIPARERLSAIGSVEIFGGHSLHSFLADKQVLFVRLGHRIDENFLKQAPALKVLCSPTTGHNHLDEPVLKRHNISLISLKGERDFLSRIRATPEHTLGLILALLRQYRGAFLDSHNRRWDRNRFRGEEIYGMHIGIIGLGRVGSLVAEYLQALGGVVGYFDVRPDVTHPGCQRYSHLSAMIEWSQVMVMCASYELGQPPVLDARHIKLLKGKYLVNTARGELVDEASLLELAGQNGLKGLATDVIGDETGHNRLDQWLKVATGRNVIVTPHIGGATWTSMAATEEFIVDKLVKHLAVNEA